VRESVEHSTRATTFESPPRRPDDDSTPATGSTTGFDGWRVRLVGDTAAGGLAGCGILTANLSAASESAATAIVEALAHRSAAFRPGLRIS
jgi:hypothetical protein